MALLTQSALAAMIDHTLLRANSTRMEIENLCREAAQFDFASVCVLPTRVSEAAKFLLNHKSVVCTVIGFPLGANQTATKIEEAKRAVDDGATELDMVINLGAMKDQNFKLVQDDIQAVVASAQGQLVKVILETCLLNDEEIEIACRLSVESGVHFVKTSTGFSKAGATTDHVALMRQCVGANVGVKASGGIRDQETVLAMIAAGANRIGTSSGVALMKGLGGDRDSY